MLQNFLLAFSQEQKKKKLVSQAAKLFVIMLLFLAVFLFVQPVWAATIEPGLNTLAPYIGLTTTDVRVTVARIIQVALGLLGIIALVIVLYGGFMYMTSLGEADKIDKAKKILTNGVIGLIIILAAFAIASFVINNLIEATTGGGGGEPPGYGDEGGALGNGIIESHYPPRNAIEIPRNTTIVVTFKVPMNVDSLVDANNNIAQTNSVPNIKIHPTASTATADNVVDVLASYTPDFKTYIFKPNVLLGRDDQAVSYTVELTNNIKKFNGSDAFGAFGSYKWNFEVSTIIDITPPQIVSVIPQPVNNSGATVPRNIVIQINFSEPINPLTIRGRVEVQNGPSQTLGELKPGTFNNINVTTTSNNNTYNIAGEFSYGNEYKTVEFVTNDLCGTNSCGGDVFCLPGGAQINVLAKAATLLGSGPAAIFPYDGLVDMADNSLDGNFDNIAQGPSAKRSPQTTAYDLNSQANNRYVADTNVGDDLQWSFYTNNLIDLMPPEIDTNPANRYSPTANKTNVSPQANPIIPYTKLMMASSLKPDKGYGDGYCKCSATNNPCEFGCDFTKGWCNDSNGARFVCTNSVPLISCPQNQACFEEDHMTLIQPTDAAPRGYWISSVNNSALTATIATLNHDNPLIGEKTYSLTVGSGVKDLMQNCYQPCSGPGCDKILKPGGKPNEYIEGSVWQPKNTSSDQGGFPSCQITTTP
ncbi:MAG: Ig-like domain-containing protein [Patescibacteria group bacterium]